MEKEVKKKRIKLRKKINFFFKKNAEATQALYSFLKTVRDS